MDFIRFFFGLVFILFIAYLFSINKKGINWKLILSGILLQIIFALLISNVGFIENIFKNISEFFVLIIDFSKQGTIFLFPDASFNGFAFSALPVVILFSSISAFLYYFGEKFFTANVSSAVSMWLFWGILTLFLAQSGYARPIKDEPLDLKRKALGISIFLIGFLCFTPIPLQILG